MLRKLFSDKFLPITRHYGFTTKINFADVLKRNVEYRGSSTSLHVKMNSTLPMDEELQEIFKLKNIKISNWIVEVVVILNFMI